MLKNIEHKIILVLGFLTVQVLGIYFLRVHNNK